MVELTIPLETNLEAAHSRKVEKYNCLVHDIQEKGYTVSFYAVEVGVRGLVNRDNKQRIKQILKQSNSQIRPTEVFQTVSKFAILSSFTIFYARKEQSRGEVLFHMIFRAMIFFFFYQHPVYVNPPSYIRLSFNKISRNCYQISIDPFQFNFHSNSFVKLWNVILLFSIKIFLDLINLKLQQFKFNDEMHLIPMFNSIFCKVLILRYNVRM